eukprot:1147255-Pelagomonas_calceolata.AAC.1
MALATCYCFKATPAGHHTSIQLDWLTAQGSGWSAVNLWMLSARPSSQLGSRLALLLQLSSAHLVVLTRLTWLSYMVHLELFNFYPANQTFLSAKSRSHYILEVMPDPLNPLFCLQAYQFNQDKPTCRLQVTGKRRPPVKTVDC